MLRSCLLFAFVTFISPSLLFGNNNLFLPGDAFFYSILSEDEFPKVSDGGVLFKYPLMGVGAYEGAFCGYAGYGLAKIPAVDEAFTENLRKAQERILAFESGQTEPINHGPGLPLGPNDVRVFIYRGTFDLGKYHLGLRYNEHWVSETVRFGHARHHARLCGFVPRADAVAESWRDAESVQGLDVVLPQSKIEPNKASWDAMTIRGPVKAYVVPRWSLERYFNRTEGTWLYEVSEEGIRMLRIDSRKKWAEVDGNAP